MSHNLNTLPLHSEELGILEYQLQLYLNAPKLRVSECHILKNSHFEAQFTNFCKSIQTSNVVQVFIPVDSLSQSIGDIAGKGINVNPDTGLSFRVGALDVDRKKEKIEVVGVTVALGRTLNFQSSVSDLTQVTFSTSKPKVSDLKVGYHSLLVSNDNEYVIFNRNQVKACYFISFAGGDNLEEANADGDICDNCGTEFATVWCVQDKARLCTTCDSEMHSSKVGAKHQRMPLAESRALMETCPIHTDKSVEYYCSQCQSPVCVQCKMVGSHSKGDAASHQLIPIKQAYQQALESVSISNPISNSRKTVINDKISLCESRLNDVISNQAQIEREINRIATQAIDQSKQLAGEKCLVIRSCKKELERKLEELEKLTQFISTQKLSAGPLAFLRAYDRHNVLMHELEDSHDLPQDPRVDGDLVVYGTISTNSSKRSSHDILKSGYNDDFAQSNITLQTPQSVGSHADHSPVQKRTSPSSRSSRSRREPLSLFESASTREQKYRQRGVRLEFQPFDGSAIIDTPHLANALYLCFPFKQQPQTHLLFSSERDGRSIVEMHKRIDNIGITCVLVKRNDYRFGGFAAAKWKNNGEPIGNSTSSFMFSLSQDAIIPYSPKVVDPCNMYATEDSLTFGKYDLILADNFDHCSAVIEHSYSAGFDQGSPEAQTFLAGAANFRADIVEVWGFFTVEQQQ